MTPILKLIRCDVPLFVKEYIIIAKRIGACADLLTK